MHERVDASGCESRRDLRIEYGVPIRSLRLGLVGKADVIEFHRQCNVQTTGLREWQPFPVEFKRGKQKKDNCDKVQLCAQAICLEEMTHIEVPRGALFYGRNRRRLEVVFDSLLRQETEETAIRLHAMISSGKTPKHDYTEKCAYCSLQHICLPNIMARGKSVDHYLLAAIEGK